MTTVGECGAASDAPRRRDFNRNLRHDYDDFRVFK
jgi:hypothetical protein